MWKELQQVITEAINTIEKQQNISSPQPEALKPLKQMDKVINLMIEANKCSSVLKAKKAEMTREAFAELYELNNDLGGFGDNIEKAAKKKSEALVKEHPVLKPIQLLLDKIITFFYHLELASKMPRARKSYNLLQQAEKDLAASIASYAIKRGVVAFKLETEKDLAASIASDAIKRGVNAFKLETEKAEAEDQPSNPCAVAAATVRTFAEHLFSDIVKRTSATRPL